MKNLQSTLLFLMLTCNLFCQQQKIISDCTIMYSVTNSDSDIKNDFQTAIKTVYIKGKELRVDINSNSFNQTVFYNDNTGEATILKSIGNTKYISAYNTLEWKNENTVYEGIAISFVNNKKEILNYNCREAVLQLKNGTSYTVYYVPDIIPSISENNFEFRNIPGLVLQYETTVHNQKIRYTATKIDFNPVPAFRFEIPKSGYKILK